MWFSWNMNRHDCGFCVLKMLECYNGRTLIGYKTVILEPNSPIFPYFFTVTRMLCYLHIFSNLFQKEMFAYRRLLAYRLMYHCWNEFNPNRPKWHGKEWSTFLVVCKWYVYVLVVMFLSRKLPTCTYTLLTMHPVFFPFMLLCTRVRQHTWWN